MLINKRELSVAGKNAVIASLLNESQAKEVKSLCRERGLSYPIDLSINSGMLLQVSILKIGSTAAAHIHKRSVSVIDQFMGLLDWLQIDNIDVPDAFSDRYMTRGYKSAPLIPSLCDYVALEG